MLVFYLPGNFVFEIRTHDVAQAGLRLEPFLPWPPEWITDISVVPVLDEVVLITPRYLTF